MSADAMKLLEDALKLPEMDRANLAARLIESLDAEVDDDAEAAWDTEVQRRLQELDSAAVKPIPWPEARLGFYAESVIFRSPGSQQRTLG